MSTLPQFLGNDRCPRTVNGLLNAKCAVQFSKILRIIDHFRLITGVRYVWLYYGTNKNTTILTLSQAASLSQPHSTRSLPNKKSIETKNSATKGRLL